MFRFASRNALLVVGGLLIFASAASAQRVAPGQPGREAAPAADTSPGWNQAEIVFLGELTAAQTGAATRSLPPIYLNRLSFKVEKVLRGNLTDKTVAAPHSYRNNTNFPYETGKKYLVALSTARDGVSVQNLRRADDEAIREVEMACALPLGWRLLDGKMFSPWAIQGKSGWSAELPADTEKVKYSCDTTGRPALLAGSVVTWSVEPVPPKVAIEWTNPDGDGEYKLTLTNPTDKPVTVPALLTQDGKILWRESLVILCQDRAYAIPGAKPVSGKIAPLVLKPKESISTVINALTLQGPQWPQGGDRVEFTFCLGEQGKTTSFYYLTRHHEPLRTAAVASVSN